MQTVYLFDRDITLTPGDVENIRNLLTVFDEYFNNLTECDSIDRPIEKSSVKAYWDSAPQYYSVLNAAQECLMRLEKELEAACCAAKVVRV